MSDSFKKIGAWIKAHPIPAAIIGVVVVVVGYFIIRSGSESDGESFTQAPGAVGADSGLGSILTGGGSSTDTPSTEAPPSTTTDTGGGSTDTGGGSTDTGGGSSDTTVSDFYDSIISTAPDYADEPAFFSAATPAASDSVIGSTKSNPIQEGAFQKLIPSAVKYNAKPTLKASVVNADSAIKKPSPGFFGGKSILPVSRKAPAAAAIKKPSPGFFGGKSMTPKSRAVTPAPAFNPYVFRGFVPGYVWSYTQRKYVKLGLAAV